MESVNEHKINSNMDIEEEILDFEEAIDFNFSDNPDALNTELLDESMLDLDGTMDFNIDESLEKRASTSTENEKNAQHDTNNNISNNNTEPDKTVITPPPEDDPEELKLGLDDEFDPDFFKEFSSGDIIENDGNLADDEFWKEFGLDPPQDILDNNKADINNTEKVEKSETDDTEVKSSQKDDIKKHDEVKAPKEEESKETKKSDSLSVSKSIPSTKSPEKEDGEIPNATTTSDNRQQQQKKQPTQSQLQGGPVQKSTQQQRSSNQRQTSQQQSSHTQQSNQNFRRSGIRRNNDWRPGNTGGEFFNGTFRTGFGPGIEGMPGMPMGQIQMGNPMIPNLSGPIIGPNIHVNPNFARLRPHAFPFTNPVTQFQPIGSGGPHMNMMPYQNQMDILPFHPSMGPMVGGRGGNNNSFSRGGSTFNHHNAMSSRRQANQQQNNNNNNNNQNQRTIPSSALSKRKTPADGFEQKEPANKRNATNGKSVVQDNKDNNKSNTSNTVDRTNKTVNSASEKTLKSGIPTLATNKETSLSSIKTKSNSNLTASGSASTKSVLKQVQRTVKNNSIKSQTMFNTSSNVKSVAKLSAKPPSAQTTTSKQTLSSSSSSSSSKPVTSSKPTTSSSLKPTLSKSTTQISSNAKSVNAKSASNTTTNNTNTTYNTANTANAGGKVAGASNKLKISNVGDNVTKRELQNLASAVPGGFSLITLERVDNSAEITFKTLDGARIFRRKHNRSQLGGSNVVINFS